MTARILFVHHSIGRQLIEQGGLRERLPGAELWDHDYNEIGLSDPGGRRTGHAFPVPADNTDPEGLVALLGALCSGTLAHVPEHDVLVVKSCFPNSDIRSDEDGARLRETYGALREAASALAQHVVLVSSPPLVVESSWPAAATRAADLATWLGATWPGPGLGYIDLFGALSHRVGPLRGTLRLDCRSRRPRDSHLSVRGARVGAAAVADGLGRHVPTREFSDTVDPWRRNNSTEDS